MLPPGPLWPRCEFCSTNDASASPVWDEETPIGMSESPSCRIMTRRFSVRAVFCRAFSSLSFQFE